MKKPQSILLPALALALWAGCSPLPISQTQTGSQNARAEGSSQFHPQNCKSAVKGVFHAHHFPPPTILDTVSPKMWAVSARPRSAHEVEMALVEISQAGQVKLQVFPYAWIGSDWALLGSLFSGPVLKEASEMEREIQEQLRK